VLFVCVVYGLPLIYITHVTGRRRYSHILGNEMHKVQRGLIQTSSVYTQDASTRQHSIRISIGQLLLLTGPIFLTSYGGFVPSPSSPLGLGCFPIQNRNGLPLDFCFHFPFHSEDVVNEVPD
jgi:hypothetical protein